MHLNVFYNPFLTIAKKFTMSRIHYENGILKLANFNKAISNT